jgi:hypothetical protein
MHSGLRRQDFFLSSYIKGKNTPAGFFPKTIVAEKNSTTTGMARQEKERHKTRNDNNFISVYVYFDSYTVSLMKKVFIYFSFTAF